jgi:hypothetical protein
MYAACWPTALFLLAGVCSSQSPSLQVVPVPRLWVRLQTLHQLRRAQGALRLALLTALQVWNQWDTRAWLFTHPWKLKYRSTTAFLGASMGGHETPSVRNHMPKPDQPEPQQIEPTVLTQPSHALSRFPSHLRSSHQSHSSDTLPQCTGLTPP